MRTQESLFPRWRVLELLALLCALSLPVGCEGAMPDETLGLHQASVEGEPGPGPEAIAPGELIMERPTLRCLGMRWSVAGDTNRNGTVLVEYRVHGTSAPWTTGLPLLHLQGEVSGTGAGAWAAPHIFAGSVMDLQEDTEYELRLTLTDPDGVIQADGSVSFGAHQRMLVMRTRRAPVASTAGIERHVYSDSWAGSKLSPWYIGLRAAYASAENGDVIVVHAGTYAIPAADKVGGQYDYVLDKQAPPSAPITIRSAGDGEVIFDGTGVHTLIHARKSTNHILEGLTFRGASTLVMAGDASTAAQGLTLSRCHFDSATQPVYAAGYHFAIRSTSHTSRDLYVLDSTFTGPKTTWTSTSSPYPYAIVVSGQGHVIAHNRISGYRDGIGFGSPGSPVPSEIERLNLAIDVYGNEISNCDDDAIQLDFGFHNIRCMRNLIYNNLMGISFQPLHGGPAYVYRNVLYNQAGSAFKTNGYPSGLMVFNNTVCAPRSAASFGAYWQNSRFINNLYHGEDYSNSVDSKKVINTGTPTPSTSVMDFNGYRWHLTSTAWKATWTVFPPGGGTGAGSSTSYLSLPALAAAQGYEAHGTSIDRQATVFEHFVTPMPNASALPSLLDLRLPPGSPAIDRGAVLENISDVYSGLAPDLGAYESSVPVPVYGPRP